MLTSFSALNTSNHISDGKYNVNDPLLNQNFNNFDTNEKLILKSHNNNHNLRLSQDSTLVSFQKFKSTFSNYNQSLRKISERTLFNHTDNENDHINLDPLTENIVALYAKYIHYLKQFRTLGDIDDLQYTILSSKFFQTNVSDLNSTRRVFSIPLKESIINLKPKTQESKTDIEEKLIENNILEISNSTLKSLYKLDTISVALKVRKILKNRKHLTLNQMNQHIKKFDASINHNTKILKKNQAVYKQYLANFIKNLDSYNHKVESFHQKNSAAQQILKSSTTPIMIKIIMAIEKLLENNINLSCEFWSFYVPMYLSMSTNGIKQLLQLDFDMKINEYLIKFRKLIQLFLLFLIPSTEEIPNEANMKMWETVISGYKYTMNDKKYLISKIIVIFDDINLKMKTGKNMLNDCELLDWVEKKHVQDEDYDMSLRSDTYEYSELMQRIPFEENTCDRTVSVEVKENNDKYDEHHYANIQTTLNNIIISMSMNSTVSQIDSEITEFLNQWTAFKLNSGNTYNINSSNPTTPKLNTDPFSELDESNINQYVSTPQENADSFFVDELFMNEPIKENTFLNNLKTLSDVELNDKLQLKLKELHIENMQNQETRFKKASQLHLKQINLIDKREKQFLNLKEDDISSYYQMDYLKVYK